MLYSCHGSPVTVSVCAHNLRLAGEIPAGLYPDLTDSGGLANAVAAALASLGSPLSAAQSMAPIVYACVETPTALSQIYIGLDKRTFFFDLWRRGACLAHGATPEIAEMARAIDEWITNHRSIKELTSAFPFVRADDGAAAYERGEEVEMKWQRYLGSRGGMEPYPRLAAFVAAAAAQPRLRTLFPYVSLRELRFSRCTGVPFTRDTPYVRSHLGGYEVFSPSGESLGRGTAVQAAELVVAALPPDCGPAVPGTAVDVPELNPPAGEGTGNARMARLQADMSGLPELERGRPIFGEREREALAHDGVLGGFGSLTGAHIIGLLAVLGEYARRTGTCAEPWRGTVGDAWSHPEAMERHDALCRCFWTPIGVSGRVADLDPLRDAGIDLPEPGRHAFPANSRERLAVYIYIKRLGQLSIRDVCVLLSRVRAYADVAKPMPGLDRVWLESPRRRIHAHNLLLEFASRPFTFQEFITKSDEDTRRARELELQVQAGTVPVTSELGEAQVRMAHMETEQMRAALGRARVGDRCSRDYRDERAPEQELFVAASSARHQSGAVKGLWIGAFGVAVLAAAWLLFLFLES